ncbi:MAG: hypothetical protein HQL22_02025 [Candidatus Omnitrophica bacterium]|nr:hypothetical protein [Candidatus Omnitrophota bacterium]
MIRIDFASAVGVYLTAVLIVLMLLWWFFSRRHHSVEEWGGSEQVERCPYCGHVFVEHTGRQPIKCTVCQSYLEVGDVPQEDKK